MENETVELGKEFVLLCKKNGYRKEATEMFVYLSGTTKNMADNLKEFIRLCKQGLSEEEFASAALKQVTGENY